MLPLKDVVAPRTFPRVSAAMLAAGALTTPVLWWANVITAPAAWLAGLHLLYLCVFADNVEDRLGPARFVALYGLAHAAGSSAVLLLVPGTPVTVGITSGAVAGILGAYMVLYPASRVLVFVPLPLDLHEVPAAFIVALYFIVHVFGGTVGVAQVFTGFLIGAAVCLVLRRPVRW